MGHTAIWIALEVPYYKIIVISAKGDRPKI